MEQGERRGRVARAAQVERRAALDAPDDVEAAAGGRCRWPSTTRARACRGAAPPGPARSSRDATPAARARSAAAARAARGPCRSGRVRSRRSASAGSRRRGGRARAAASTAFSFSRRKPLSAVPPGSLEIAMWRHSIKAALTRPEPRRSVGAMSGESRPERHATGERSGGRREAEEERAARQARAAAAAPLQGQAGLGRRDRARRARAARRAAAVGPRSPASTTRRSRRCSGRSRTCPRSSRSTGRSGRRCAGSTSTASADLGVIRAFAEKYRPAPARDRGRAARARSGPSCRPTATTRTYQARLFIIARELELREGQLHTEQISIFVGHRTVLTFQEAPGDVWDPIRQRIRTPGSRAAPERRELPGYSLIDAIVDNCFPILEHFGDRLEELEDARAAAPERGRDPGDPPRQARAAARCGAACGRCARCFERHAARAARVLLAT